MFIHLLRKHTALSLREIGETLGMKYRAVSEMMISGIWTGCCPKAQNILLPF